MHLYIHVNIVRKDSYKLGHYLYDSGRKPISKVVGGLQHQIGFILGKDENGNNRFWNPVSKQFEIYVDGTDNAAVTEDMIDVYNKFGKSWEKSINGMYTLCIDNVKMMYT